MTTALAGLENDKIATLNQALENLIASGDVKLAELNPSLTALLTDPANGGFPGRSFAGKVAGFQEGKMMPTFDDKDDLQPVDILELKDVTGHLNSVTFNFYARNGGLKAKLSAVKDFAFVVIAYKGEVESEKKGYNPFKDYLVMGCKNEADAKKAFAAIEKAVGKPSYARPVGAAK